MREEFSPIKPATSSNIWHAHVKAWRKSGLTRAGYCRQQNLSYHALTYWYKKTVKQQRETAISFVPVPAVRISQASIHNHAATLKVDLGNSLKIEVYDGFIPATLSQVIQTLRGR